MRLTKAQARLLELIRATPGLDSASLALRYGISQRNTQRYLQELHAARLIERRRRYQGTRDKRGYTYYVVGGMS